MEKGKSNDRLTFLFLCIIDGEANYVLIHRAKLRTIGVQLNSWVGKLPDIPEFWAYLEPHQALDALNPYHKRNADIGMS